MCEFERKVLPMEVKAGLSTRSKSLHSFDQQFGPSHLIRSNLLNLKRDGKVCNLPLYGVSQFRRLIETIGPQDAEQNIFGQLAFGLDQPDYVLLRAPKPTLISATS